MDKDDTLEEGDRERPKAMAKLNRYLRSEGYEAFYGEDEQCHLRNIRTKVVTHFELARRAMTEKEREREKLLDAYLNACSEDDLIEHILTPLFRSMCYERIRSRRIARSVRHLHNTSTGSGDARTSGFPQMARRHAFLRCDDHHCATTNKSRPGPALPRHTSPSASSGSIRRAVMVGNRSTNECVDLRCQRFE